MVREGDNDMMDMHTHTAASFDCDAAAEDMAQAALARGLSGFAVTDHADMPWFWQEHMDVTVERSWDESGALAREYVGRLTVLRGLELGEPLCDPTLARALLDARPYDFVLGSVHAVRGEEDYYFWDFAARDIDETLVRYFDEVQETIAFGGFHALAHLTYPVRYMPPERRPRSYAPWQDAIDAIFRALIEREMALEVNTAGLRSDFGATQPDEALLRRYYALGGRLVTVGSDAHRPADMGAGLDEAYALLRRVGFRTTTVFVGGQPQEISLETTGRI